MGQGASDEGPADEFAADPEACRRRRGAKWSRARPDGLAAWIADMDFAPCPVVAEAILEMVGRGDLGYPEWPTYPLAEPFSRRMHELYGWSPDPGLVRPVTDLIQAVQVVIHLMSRPGQGVALHVPSYPPFLEAIEAAGRRLVPLPLQEHPTRWGIDVDGAEQALAGADVALLILVNPHNPTGHVMSQSELEGLAELAHRHDLTVISDEIHAELIYAGHRHIPFASLDDAVADRTVTLTSASKAFNLAGLRAAVAHLGSASVRQAWDDLPPQMLGSVGVVGVEATLAAWERGTLWLTRLRRHLAAQRDHLGERLGELAGVAWRPPEATYLAWLDCRGTDLGPDPADYLSLRAGLELSSGPLFGPGGVGHVRVNFATSRPMLDEMVDRMAEALSSSAERAAAGASGKGPRPPGG